MRKVASEDSVRRGLERIDVAAGASWLHGHLEDTVRPLLSEPWVLDCDTTIKPLYGHQEGAVVRELQPEEAGPSLARLPCVPDGRHASCSGRRGCAGQPSSVEERGALAVGLA